MDRAASILVFLGLAVALAAGAATLSDDDLKTEEFFWGGVSPWGLNRGGWGAPWDYYGRGGPWGSPWGFGGPYAGFSAGVGPFGFGFGLGRYGGWW